MIASIIVGLGPFLSSGSFENDHRHSHGRLFVNTLGERVSHYYSAATQFRNYPHCQLKVNFHYNIILAGVRLLITRATEPTSNVI